MEKPLNCLESSFFYLSSYHNSRIWLSWPSIKRNYWRPLILMICRISTLNTLMKFLTKVACKFPTNLKQLIEQTSACTSSIIIKIQTISRIWEPFTKIREQLITSLKIISKTLVLDLRFLEQVMLSTRTMISLKVAWQWIRERIWLAMN